MNINDSRVENKIVNFYSISIDLEFEEYASFESVKKSYPHLILKFTKGTWRNGSHTNKIYGFELYDKHGDSIKQVDERG